MSAGGLSDLDELVLRCRDEEAKRYIAEAVACYRAGAFRSSIVATWIAVVFDFLYKLRELELNGDKNARKRLVEYEKTRVSNDIAASTRFEREILQLAKDEFELISQTEYDDLDRLQHDRNRCAHPSMQSATEPYRPSAELARYHLTTAVNHLLSQPPVQGRAALSKLWGDIQSEYFPTDLQRAVKIFQAGPIHRARQPLIGDLVIKIVKDLLIEDQSESQRARLYSALLAVCYIHTRESEAILEKALPSIIGALDDHAWPMVIAFLRHIPHGWLSIGEPAQVKAEQFVATFATDIHDSQVIVHALHVSALKAIGIKRADELSSFTIISEYQSDPLPELLDIAVERFAGAQSFKEARNTGDQLLLKVAPQLSANQLHVVLTGFLSNRQVWDSIGMESILEQLFDHTKEIISTVEEDWVAIYVRICTDRDFKGSWLGLRERIEGHIPKAKVALDAKLDFDDFDDVPF